MVPGKAGANCAMALSTGDTAAADATKAEILDARDIVTGSFRSVAN
jgi:hypothetical protein